MQTSILLAGHCGYDNELLEKYLQKHLGEHVYIGYADTKEELLEEIESVPYSLAIVNRILNGDSSNLLDYLQEVTKKLPVMLVSEKPEAQSEAELLGAKPGFSKTDLLTDMPAARIMSALNA